MEDAYIRFMASVIPQTADQLLRIIDQKIAAKYKRIHLLISSPGGSVFHGLSIYNFLRGAPIEVFTYNFGSVDSIGVVIFCAGRRRYSVPHARFLIHGVRFNIAGNASLDEKQMEENLKGLKIDQSNIARVIADTTEKPFDKVEDDMNKRITLSPSEAKDYGLVHTIQSDLFPLDADISVIGEIIQGPMPFPIQLQVPQQMGFTQLNNGRTRSADLDFAT